MLARKLGITIVRGIKGKPKLLMNGHAYFRNNGKGPKIYWLCAKNRYNHCKARLITCGNTGDMIIKNQEHNHDPDPDICKEEEKKPHRKRVYNIDQSVYVSDQF